MSGTYDNIRGFHFVQASASTTWTILHELNTITPVVDCWLSGVKLIPLSVDVTDANTVVITFTSAQSGNAFVV